MENVKRFLVMVLFALVSSTAIAQTDGTKSKIDGIIEFDRLQKYITLNVSNIENWSNIAISLLEELEYGVSPMHDNPYYWEFVYKKFKSCLDKASRDLATYNKVPPTSKELKNIVSGFKDNILPSGYELLNSFLLQAKLNNYITNI